MERRLRVLHVGCGDKPLPPPLDEHEEVRVDIDPGVNPHIVASMTALGEVGEVDFIYCCHALEHLYPHEVFLALGEFHRVLKVGGKAMIVVPDLEGVIPDTKPLMGEGENAICGLHLFYGDHREIPSNPYMAHHSGFIRETLSAAMSQFFPNVKTERQPNYNLVGIGIK